MVVRLLRLVLVLGALLPAAAFAQVPVSPPDTSAVAPVVRDTTASDTTVADTTAGRPLGLRPDSLAASLAPTGTAANGDGEPAQPVQFAARDSLVILLGPQPRANRTPPDSARAAPDRTPSDSAAPDTTRRARLYGAATATYDAVTLTAGLLELDLDANELRARRLGGAPDDTTGLPTFSEGDDTFTGEELAYNLTTRRGRVVYGRTQIEDGYLLGGVIKQPVEHILYVKDGMYTTCSNPRHVHYALVAGQMKIVDNQWIYTGPVNLRLLGLPTPLWLPFGYFPAAEGRRSGPLPPTYGEDSAYGFYLRNVGWYWAISDYLDAQVTGGFWTRGSYELGTYGRYVRRYHYSGDLRLTYAFLRQGERGDPDGSVRRSAAVRWNHQQTLSPTASFTGNVDLATESYLRGLSESVTDNVRQTSTSTVTYNKRWAGGARSLSLNLRGVQTFSTGAADFTLPSLSFSQRQLFPFKRATRGGRTEAWYERIALSYSGSLTNTYAFRPDTSRAQGISWLDGLFSYDQYVRATGDSTRFRATADHRIPLSASFSVRRLPLLGALQLNLTPNVSYTERWLTQTDRRFVDTLGVVRTRAAQGFTAIRQVSASLSANTEAYGTFPWRIGRLDGFRHVLRPSASFSFQPQYDRGLFNYYRTVTDTSGRVIPYPIVSGLSNRPTAALSFGLGNVFQARIVETDSTTDEPRRRVLQLLTLNLSSSYNFAADSLKFGSIAANANTQIGTLGLSASAGFSPYRTSATGVTINRYTPGLVRLTAVSLAASTSLRGGDQGGLTVDAGQYTPPPDPYPGDPYGERFHGLLPARQEVPPGPWNASFSFSYSFTPAIGSIEARRQAALSVSSFNWNVSPAWRLSGSTGYDFIQHELTLTSINVTRDLHCWEAQLNWVPFGIYKRFGFSIYVKSGQLRDLLRLDVPRSDRSSQLGL